MKKIILIQRKKLRIFNPKLKEKNHTVISSNWGSKKNK